MKVSFNFDTGARRIRLRAEDPLEQAVLEEMAHLCSKGVNMKITSLNVGADHDKDEFEIEMRINGFAEGKEKKAE
jgi:hypothetical protein